MWHVACTVTLFPTNRIDHFINSLIGVFLASAPRLVLGITSLDVTLSDCLLRLVAFR
jgi:hypothetical protein